MMKDKPIGSCEIKLVDIVRGATGELSLKKTLVNKKGASVGEIYAIVKY